MTSTRTRTTAGRTVFLIGVALSVALAARASASPDSGASHPAEPPAATVLAAATADTTSAATDSGAVSPAADGARLRAGVEALRDLELENLTVDRERAALAYENRRFRHPADALGWIEQATGVRPLAFERRLGMLAAAVTTTRDDRGLRFRVRYPSDPDFPTPPRGERLEPTWRSVDVRVGPLMAYEVGRVTDPLQVELQVEPSIVYNPWPGGRATASVTFPVYSDFTPTDQHPDVDRIRPGLLTVEQFAWVPKVALTSATVGLFANNRYGVSVGAARPLFGGAVLLDSQADLTGFVAFLDQGITYSELKQWSGFGGITYRLPVEDISLRLRVARFLYGDDGAEIEFRRAIGDLEIGLFALRSSGLDIEGVRINFPIPPMRRSTRGPVRVQPVERLPFLFRTDATPAGEFVVGIASRVDYLRNLNEPSLHANRYRYERALGRGPAPQEPATDWVSTQGMTGFIWTPWAGVRRDGSYEIGYNNVPRKWANDSRGVYSNEIYYADIGLFPRVEGGIRFTRVPGLTTFGHVDPESELTTDTDHMASVRISLLEPRLGRPGLAVGVEDLEGTRRHHASYAVAGLPLSILRVQSRFSFGYAFHVFTASRRVLDGAFGAIEVSPWRVVATRVEYDSEKWNLGLGVDLGFGLRFKAAALNGESLSVGVGWYHGL